MAVISGHGGSITGISTYGVISRWSAEISGDFIDIGAFDAKGFAYPWWSNCSLKGSADGVLDDSGLPRVPFFQSAFAISLKWTSTRTIEFNGYVSTTGMGVSADGAQWLNFGFLSYGEFFLY